MTMNVVEAVVRVRERIHDRDGLSFDEDEVLRALDDTMRSIFTVLRTHGDELATDYLDVAIGSLTQLETGVYEYAIPETVVDPQLLEARRGNDTPYPIRNVPLEHKDVARSQVFGRGLTWNWGRRGALEIRGILSGWSTVRIWFARTIPPLFRAVASAGSTATSLVVSSPVGQFKGRDDLYSSFQFEATSGSNIGQVRRCSAQTASTLTVAAFAATMASIPFAMLIPVPDEHLDYVVDLTALRFLIRQGSVKEQQQRERELGRLMAGFESGIACRQTGEPVRFVSSRTIR